MKNRLSAYSIAILLGLSLATTVVVLHNPFATQALAAPHLSSGSSSITSQHPSSSGSAVPTQNSTSPGPGLLTQNPPALQSHSNGVDDGAPPSYNGTTTDN